MVSPASEMVIVVRVVFTYCKWRRSFFFFSAQIAVIGSWGKMLLKLQFSQLFGQLIVESIEKCFVCFLFSMPTVTALFLPRSDLGCALAL